MTAKLKLLIRVIAARIAAGEPFDGILAGYPKLLPQEIEVIKTALNIE